MDDSEFDSVGLHDLVSRWQSGDRAAIDQLVMATAKRLELLARKMLRSFPNVRGEADTADVVQNSTFRLITTLRKLKPATTRDFYNLAAVHVRRELIDLARHCRLRHKVSLDQNESSESNVDFEQAESTDRDIDHWTQFHEAVDDLPTKLRETVGLTFYHGWTLEQIAELFGVDVRTIRRWWLDASSKLHQSLKGDLPDLTSMMQ